MVAAPAGHNLARQIPRRIHKLSQNATIVAGQPKPKPRLLGRLMPGTIVAREPQPPLKKLHQIEFFHAQVVALHSAFVVDCSDSLTGPKFELARLQLARAIVDLQPEQSFFVVFFNFNYIPMLNIPMLNPKRAPALAPANALMKAQVLNWLATACSWGGRRTG